MKKPTISKAVLATLMLLLNALSNALNYITDTHKLERIPLLNALKKPVFLKACFVLLMLLLNEVSFAQTYKPFSIRKNIDIRGKMLVVGNNILGKDKTLPCNDDNVSNQDISMKYIDIDGDASTFSSSSADLLVPKQKDGSPTTCYRVAYAALYWGAVLKDGSRTNINKIKLKLPGATAYNDITGQVVYDAVVSPIIPDSNKPYACFADVTSLLSGLPNLSGTYTVADVISSEGFNGSTGLSAGWTLFVVYEDPSLHMKSFTVFDGFSHVYASHFEKIPVTGFRTPPSGPIDVQFAYAALDGDKPQGATKLEFGTKQVITPLRPANNFFISTIENTNGVSTPRVPYSSNTLGYDTGVLEVIGADPEYIDHNQTSTDFTLQVAKGQADPVFVFFSAYAVDIIAPKIDLTKIVKNSSGTDIGGGNVALGQFLTYEISYRNVGNDNVTNFTIKDVLPINVTFNYPADLVLPTGVTVDPVVKYDALGNQIAGYNPVTRTIIFNIPDSSVLVNGGLYTIKINVRVATDCNSLVTACSNEIKNQAFATYQGVINPKVVQEEGSFASTACKLGSPESTNFLVDISKCTFTQNVILCGSSVVLKASDGYINYSWSRNQDGSSPIGTGQTFTATQPGIYYVHSTAPATCKDIVEEITVKYFGVTNTNPVIPFADQVVQCSNDGKLLPYIFLCGANATKLIKTGISGTTSIVWEKLDEVACPSTAIANCANETLANTCWKSVGTGPDYLANTSGQFRVTLRYPNGCFSVFYFNVYQNLLNPTFSKKDIICGTSGEIIIGDVPNGYEYSLDGIKYQLNDPKFIITAPGIYTVYIKQNGVTTFPCIFTVPKIQIDKRDLNVRTFVTQPTCHGVSNGSIKLVAENVEPQYSFSIYQGTTEINSVGPISANEYTFANLSAGDYTVNVSTDPAKCVYKDIVKIIDPTLLEVKVSLSKALTCVNGELTINVLGGTANYNYYVNGVDVLLNTALTTITVPVPTAQKYDIKVVDVNNCEATTSITVAAIPKPEYTVKQTNVLCYGSKTGEIKFNVTNDNGYTLSYGISTDNGVTYSYASNATISNLAPGVYYVILKYSLNGSDCLDTPQKITITEPAAALTASAGVSELAGCGQAPFPADYGKVRISNPQGGTPFPMPDPYLYSFDNQGTWVTTNEAYVAPGTYTLYIKDANGCIFPMPGIILEEKPVAPTIKVSDPVFNCDGSANSTVTVTNAGSNSFTYTYLLDGNPNPNTADPKTFLNVPTGSHTISVNYTLTSVPTYSNLLNEDFGKGAPTTTSGIAAAYCFNDQHVLPPYFCPNPTQSVEDNQYSVASFFWRSDDPSSTNVGAWYHFKDHTVFNPTVTDGRYLLVNIGSAAGPNGVLYSKPINNVIPNQPLIVDLYLGNLIRSSKSGVDPDFIIEIVDSSGNLITPGQATGAIPKNEIWNKKSLSFNPGANTSLTFKIRSGSTAYSGNDAVIDDIKVYQLPKACVTKVDFPFEVASGNKFTASITGFKDVKCAGDSNGEITIAAQNFKASGYQYKIGSGAWINVTTSPYTIKPLAVGTYTVQIRYDNTGTCSFSFSQEIKAPSPLKVDAIATPAKCSVGATVTASAVGGTLAYEFQLDNIATVGIDYPFTNNAVFTDIPPGTYIVSGKDANGCTDNRDTNLVIAAPAGVSAVVQNTGLCFDPTTGANITVNVSGGTGSYSYQTSTDGITYGMSSATFTGPSASFTYLATATGTYWFKITDSFGCSTIVSQVINEKLSAGAIVSPELDCDAAPANEAVITATISGGTSPFTYTVKNSLGDTLFTSGSITGPTFTYNTGVADTYTFDIKDKNGCVTTTTAKVNPKAPVTAKATVTDVTCNGFANGSVTLEGLTGAAPFTFNFNNLGFSSITTYGPLAGSVAGISYDYQVKDNKGCIVDGTAVVKQPDVIVSSASITTPYTCTSTATITVVLPIGGNPGYNYVLYKDGVAVAGPQTTLTFPDLSVPGDYTVTITDSKGCTLTKPAGTIVALNPPTDLTFNPSALSCPTNKANVTITTTTATSPGNTPYTYTILPSLPVGAVATATGIDNLSPGITYTFEVTDAKGCKFQKPYTITALTPIVVDGVLVKNVECSGTDTGAVDYTIKDLGNGVNYSYTIDGVLPATTGTTATTGSTTIVVNATGLTAGNHTLTVTDLGTNCTASKTIEVFAPALPLAITATTVTPMTCLVNGKAVVNTTGGWGSNTYTLTQPGGTVVGPQPSNTFANLTLVGSYTVEVKDLNGCTVSDIFVLADKVLPTASIDGTSDLCYDSTGKATIKVTPDTFANYVYSINGGTLQNHGTFANLNPGDYVVRVTDTNTGCYIDLPSQTIAKELTFNAVQSKSANCIGQDAEIKGTISGGTLPYTYTVTINGTLDPTPIAVTGTTFLHTDPTATAAAVDTEYLFTITDAAGCTDQSTVIVLPKTDPKITSATPVSSILCNGDATGSITVVIDPNLGVGPYVINVTKDNSVLPVPIANKDYFTQTSGLPAGTYIVTVTDANGCKDVVIDVVIEEPDPIVVDFSKKDLKCVGGGVSQGEIIIKSVKGGTGPYDYYVTGINYSQTKPDELGTAVVFQVVNFGLYQIRVVDANGCSEVISDVMIAAPVDYLDIDINLTATCATGGTADVTIGSAFPSPGPYHFAVYTGPGQVFTADGTDGWQGEMTPKSTTFTDLIPGMTYSFVVYDEITLCYYYQTATAPIPSTTSLTLDKIIANNITCLGANNGSVSFDVVNGYASSIDVSYQVYEALSNLPIAGISGTATIAAGGTLNIVNLGILPVGSYYILVQETSGPNAGCGVPSDNFNIKESPELLALTVAPSIKNDNSCTLKAGQITVIAKGGTTIKEDIPKGITAVPYLYQIFDDTGVVGVIDGTDHNPNAVIEPSFPATFNIATHIPNTFNKDAGNYLVYVRDAYGCIQWVPVTVGLDPEPVITAVVNNQCVEEGKFVINVDLTTSGIGTHSYSLDGDAFITRTAPFTYTNLASGPHTVEVKDFNGCGNKVTLPIIAVPLDINASFTTLPSCKNTDGTITAVVTGGVTTPTTNFEYTLVNNTIVTPDVVQLNDPVFKNQAAGKYTITVKDLNTTCTKSTTIDLLIPTDIVLALGDIVVTSPNCTAPQGNSSNGTITVNLPAANNNPNYKYTLTPVAPLPVVVVGPQADNYFTGLVAGTYNVTVTSGNGCSKTLTVKIDPPVAVTAAASASLFTCSGTNSPNATVVTVTGTGGTGTYSFSKDGTNYFPSNSSPADNKYTFNVFDNGAIQSPIYYVKDANGCVDDVTIPINPFPKLVSATASQVTQIDCANGNEIIKVAIDGGSLPANFEYQVAVNGGVYSSPIPITAGDITFNYTVTTAGSYYEFKITDKTTGCSVISNVYDVPLFDKIKIVASASKTVRCSGENNGAIEINVTGYTGTYDYEVYNNVPAIPVLVTSGSNDTGAVNGNPFVIPFGFIAGNDYTVVVKETSAYPKCTTTSNSVVITEPAKLTLSTAITVVNKNCFNTTGAQVTVPLTSIGGGTPGFTYAFVPKGASPAGLFTSSNTKTIATTQIAPLFDEWDVYVQDANLCPVVQTIQVTTDPMPTVIATVASQCPDPAGYTINVVGTGVATALAPLEYSLDGGSFQSGTSFIVTTPKSYTITVKDANQCTTTVNAAVTIFDPLQLQFEITTIPTCLGANGVVTLTAKGGKTPASYGYSSDGTTYSSLPLANIFGGLAPSATPYTFYVKDMGTNCVKTVDVLIDLPNTTINFGLSKTDITCKGDNDGTITVNLDPSTSTVNNNPIYRYTLTETLTGTVVKSIQDANIFKDLPAGDYTVTVTSGRGCEATATETIIEPAVITVPAPTVVQYGCTAGTNGTNYATITVTRVTGGSGVAGVYANYQFIKTVGAISTEVYFGPSNVYTETDLSGGNYTINVYDSKGCSGTVTTAIDQFISLDKVSVVVDKAITCLVGEEITVSVSSIGGTPDNLRITVEDVLYDAVTGAAIKGTIYTGSKDVTVPFASFTGLPVGNYLITVDNLDTGCSIKTVHYVNAPNTFELKVDKISDVICFGSDEGSISLTFVDKQNVPSKAGAFTYTISGPTPSGPILVPSAGPINITGLKAGLYTVSAKLNSGLECSVDTNFTIDQPTEILAIKETHTPITCATGDGTISATATGGWPGGYEFQLELASTPGIPVAGYAWSSVSEFTGLSSSLVDYTVRVRDSKLCSSVTVDVSLVDPTPIAATIITDKTLLTCFGNQDATITVTSATGGSTNYLYTLEATYPDGTVTKNGPQQSTIFSGLGAGSYQVLVSDNWSCSNPSNTIVINEPTEVKPNLVLASRLTCDTQATLTLSATGGTGLYTYSVGPNFATNLGTFTTSVTFPVPVGTYHYYVKDANGCVSYLSNDIQIDPLQPLTINLEKENPVINCAGDNTGVIVATAQGGLGNYVYTLTNLTTGVVTGPQPTGNFTGLIAGNYKVHVDSEDCDADKDVTITEPDTPLTAAPLATFNVTCNGFENGKIIISASGGTGIIKYAISPRFDQWFETGIFDKLKPGFYDIMAQDQNGCYVRFTGVEITEPTAITPSTIAGSIVPEICFGDRDGAFSIDIAGGTAPYSVSLDNPSGIYTTGTATQTGFDFTGLTGGDHTVYIRDANLCTTEWTVSLPESIKLDPKTIVDYGCSGNSPSNSVTVTIDASITNPADVDYSLDGVSSYQPSNVFTNVPPGIHFIRARHTNGCEKDTPDFTILQFDPLALTIADGGLNEIVATATGGAGKYQYTFNGEDNGGNNKYIIYKSGDYTVTVTDANGCVASATRYFEYIDVCVPNYFTPNGDGVMDGWAPGCTINYKDLTFDIFDRYGRKIATYRLGQYWDGKYNGAELPSGDYWYVLKLNDLKDAREFVGHFTLYR